MSLAKWVAAAAVLLLAGPSVAQAPTSDPADPDAVLVDELVVVARDKGPAWWRVSDGDTTVYVLGAPSVLPKSQPWDQSVLERRLAGANSVILPFNSVSVRLTSVPGLMIRWATLKSGPAEDRMPAPLQARFVKARESVGQPAKRYGYRNDLLVGVMLVGDYREHARLTSADPAKTVEHLAKARKLKVESRAISLGGLVGQAANLSKDAQRACLQDALDEIEAGPGGARAAGRAWAEGDVPNAVNQERSYERCLARLPGALNLDARFKADQAAAIEKALAQPGHSVAVVQLRPLLSQGGVLDRLRAKGYTIKTPGEE